jgi:hypothetical protein
LVAGIGNIAATNYQAVVGKYNNSVAGNLFTVGNGTNSSSRSNALEVYENGTVKIKDLSGQGTLPGTGVRTVFVNDAGILTTTSPIRILSIPPQLFTAQDSDNYTVTPSGITTPYDGFFADSYLYAPIQLPYGSTLESLNFHYTDENQNRSISITMYKVNLITGLATVVWSS